MKISVYHNPDAPVKRRYLAKAFVDMIPSHIEGKVRVTDEDSVFIGPGYGHPDGAGMLPRSFYGPTSEGVRAEAEEAMARRPRMAPKPRLDRNAA